MSSTPKMEPRAPQQATVSLNSADRVRAAKTPAIHEPKTICDLPPYSHEEKQGMLAG
jgi:hypothetical protein